MKKPPKKKQPLKTFGVRADSERIKLAESLGINTGEIFRQALDQEIMHRQGKCPTCGHVPKHGLKLPAFIK